MAADSRRLRGVTPEFDPCRATYGQTVASSSAVLRGPQLPVLRPQGQARPSLLVAFAAGLGFALLCAGVAVIDQDWVLLALPAALAGPVLAMATGSSVVALPGRLLAWGRDLPPGSIALVAGVNVGPGDFVAGHLRVLLVAHNGAARWVSARGFTDTQIHAVAEQLGAAVEIDWDTQITESELASRYPGAIPLWRAKPERTGRAVRPRQAPGVYLAIVGGVIVLASLTIPFASTTFEDVQSFGGIPSDTLQLGASNGLLLVGVLVAWCVALAAVERLVLHRGPSSSALTLSAALVGGLAGAISVIGLLSDLADPGFSTGQAGPGIPVFFVGILALGIGSVIDIVAPPD